MTPAPSWCPICRAPLARRWHRRRGIRRGRPYNVDVGVRACTACDVVVVLHRSAPLYLTKRAKP